MGVWENAELLKMFEILQRLICSMNYMVGATHFAIDLVSIKNPLHTALFLCVGSCALMCYELAIPLLFIALAM